MIEALDLLTFYVTGFILLGCVLVVHNTFRTKPSYKTGNIKEKKDGLR